MYLQIVDNSFIIDFDDIIADKNINIHKLVLSTFNTWQKSRDLSQKESDTAIGKIAEFAVATAFRIFNIPLYHSYDSFRTDGFKLHAPFDGLLCKNLNKELIDIINSSVANIGPKISSSIRKEIRKFDAFTVEVKSTRLAKKYKERANFKNYDNQSEVENLIKELSSLDFITYPYFSREGDYSFSSYCDLAKAKLCLNYSGESLKAEVLKHERNNSDDIYIRVFIDEELHKAIIMGWIDKKSFYENATLMKLIKRNKSENALYFACPLKLGRAIPEINSLTFYYLKEAEEKI